jgi:cell division control protein 6
MGNSEIFFDPYSESDVLSILKDRVKKAFVLPPKNEVLSLCSKLSADSHGDARRAIDLLRISGECSNGKEITLDNVKTAYNVFQKDRLNSIVKCASHHQRNIIGAICLNLLNSNGNSTATSEIYEKYCKMMGKEESLSYRRVVDLLVELVNTGLLSSRTISRGRKGYGTEYTLLMPLDLVGLAIDESWWKGKLESKKSQDLVDDLQKKLRSGLGRRSGLSRSLLKYSNLLK